MGRVLGWFVRSRWQGLVVISGGQDLPRGDLWWTGSWGGVYMYPFLNYVSDPLIHPPTNSNNELLAHDPPMTH